MSFPTVLLKRPANWQPIIPKVEIDYTQKKNLRKPNGAKPGFVVYYTNYSLLIEPDISGLTQVL